ncbi:MAG: fibronectin type III domain-containing protein, partial [Elusimicrobiota bacterium]
MRTASRPVVSLLLAALFSLAAPVEAAWRATEPMPAGYFFTKSVAGNGYLYKIGGLGDKGICGTQDVLFARLNVDGTVGPWAATTSLPGMGTTVQTVTCGGIDYQLSDIITGWGYEAVYSSGTVFIFGGNLWNFGSFSDGSKIHFSNAVFFAKANADGTLGAWQRGPDLPAPAFFAAAAEYDGIIYLSGGRDDSGTSFVRRDVYFSRLNADGSPGAWQVSASPLPGGLWLHGSEAAAGRLYVSGGVTYDPFPRDQITNSVFSAPIAADGTLSAWVSEASLPLGLAGHGMRERHGTLYTIGGQEPDWPSVSVHAAAINADGTLAPWTSSDPLPLALYMHGSARGGDALYAVGGTDLQRPLKGTYYLPDLIAPAVVADLSAAAQDSTSILLQWTAPGNDGAQGAVAAGRYELRMAADAASLATAVPESWTASFEPGQSQTRLVAGLAAGSRYFFSLRAADAAGNLSADSNAPSASTFFVATSTEATPVVRLESPVAGLTISQLPGASVPTATKAMGLLSGAAYSIAPSAVLAPQGLLSIALTPTQFAQSLFLYWYVDATVGWSTAALSGQAVDAAGVLTGKLARTGLFGFFDPRSKPPAPPPSAVSFAVKFDPKTLNLRSRGRSIEATLSAAGSVRPSEIDARTAVISAVDGVAIAHIRALRASFEDDEDDRDDHGRGGRDRDEHSRNGRHSRASRELRLAFSRSAVAAVLSAGSPQLTLTGTLKDGRSFTALGTMRVIA